MKNNKSIFFVLIFIFLVSASTLIFAQTLYSENTSTENDNETNSLKNKLLGTGGFECFGFSTGAVLKENYNTGFGFGISLKRPLLNPMLEITTSGYLWGASIDSLDITSIGIEESLTLKKIIGNDSSIFSGITVGYYMTNDRIETIKDNKTQIIENNNPSFETYITLGGTYPIANKRMLLTQIKYGLTKETSELHMLIGLIFCK